MDSFERWLSATCNIGASRPVPRTGNGDMRLRVPAVRRPASQFLGRNASSRL